MKTRDRFITVSLTALISLLSTLVSAVSPAEEPFTMTGKNPMVSCKIMNPLDSSKGIFTNFFNVSNIEYIDLKVSIVGGTVNLPFNQHVTNDFHFADCGTNDACIAILCEKVVDEKKTEVPIKVINTGGGGHNNDRELSISLEIPISDVEKQDNLKRYVDEVELATANKTNSNPQLLGLLHERREAILSALTRNYMQNQLGLYEISARYVSKVPGFWNGETHSQPVRIDVEDKGDFTDLLRAKRRD